MPWDTEKKSLGLKEQLKYKGTIPRTLPNGRGAAGTLLGLEELVNATVYTSPSSSVNGKSRVWHLTGLLPQWALGL